MSHCAEKSLNTTGQVRTMPPSTTGEECSTAGGVANRQSPTPDNNIGIKMVSQGGLLTTKQSFVCRIWGAMGELLIIIIIMIYFQFSKQILQTQKFIWSLGRDKVFSSNI